MTVARLLKEMPPEEFAQWKALYTVEREAQQQQAKPPADVVSIAEFKERMRERGRG